MKYQVQHSKRNPISTDPYVLLSTHHSTGTKELASEDTATKKTPGKRTCFLPNLSDSLPIINAPGIHPMNSMDCDRLA